MDLEYIQLLENYKISNAERVAGAGFKLELLNQLNKDNLSIRQDCAMAFNEKLNGNFEGHLKEENRYIINKDGKETYLISTIHINKDKLYCKRHQEFTKYLLKDY